MVRSRTAELLPGTLDMLILKALTLGRMHGYGIAQRIQQFSGEALQVEEGFALSRATTPAGEGLGAGGVGHVRRTIAVLQPDNCRAQTARRGSGKFPADHRRDPARAGKPSAEGMK
jgi:hypothetical protein